MSSPARTPRSKRAKRGRNTEDPTSPQNGNQTPSTRNSQSAPTTPSSSSKKSRKSDMSSPSRRRRRGGKMDTSPGADLMSLPPSSPAGEQQVQGSLSPSSPAPFRTGFTTSEIDLSSPLNYGTPNSRDDGPRTPRTPGIGSTPIRQRPDIRSDRKMRQVDLTGSDGGGNLCLSREPARTCRWSDPEHHWCKQVQLCGRGYCQQQQQDLPQRMATKADRRMGIISNKTPPDHCPEDGFIDCVVLKEQDASHISSDISMDGPQLVIWGTDVVVSRCKEKFRRFVQRFVEEEVDCDERFEGMDVQEPYYLQRLDEINVTGEPFLCINSDHLRQFDADLYRQLVSYPQEVIPTFDMAVNEMFFDRFPNTILEHQIQVRPYNTEKTKNMRGLNPQDIDLLITIYGMVIRTSNLVPEMREGFFRCYVCGNSQTVEIDRGRIAEPYLCTNCNTNHSFALVHNRSQFSDKQIVKLQESPEDMPPGQTPHTVLLYAHGDLVDKVQPGDRVTVTGIYRATPLRVNPRQRNVKSVYKTHIDIVHFRKTDVKRLHEHSDEQDRKDSKLSPERIELLKELSKSPDIYEKLARSIAPSIYENDDIKKGILLQLFGGCRKDFSNTGRGNFRSEINILLCGDPGTSKSQFLQYVHNLVPRGQYTSGKGSSAVGLTAYVTRDPETRQLVLQTGALVLSDNGVCCIDEFDKMTENTRSVLHEVMEQQTMSIAKAGIICSLNARTSILAAANPVESQWNKNKTITENIMLPHTLLSRFDLIFLILDPQDEFFDRRLASHLVSLYFKSQDEAKEDFMNTGTLKDYIAYARQCVNPVISEEAGQHFIQAYVDMRKVGSGRGQISAYPRQLESLIRLAEAHARMRFSEIVELADVEEAQRLYKEALKQAAVDPSTGKIDITILTTGISGAARKRRAEVTQALKKLIQAKGKVPTLKYQKLFEDFRGTSDLPVTREMFEESLRDLQDDDFLVVTSKIIRLCA